MTPAKRISPLLMGLFASIALNGILLGSLFAANNGSDGDRLRARGSNGAQSIDIGNIARALPAEHRDRFTQALSDDERKAIQNVFREHNHRQRELGALIQAQELDINALKLAMSDIRDRRTHISLLGDEQLIEFIASLSVQERQDLVLRLNSRRGGNDDGSRGDNAMGDGSMGDGSMGDGSMGDGLMGDGQRTDIVRPVQKNRHDTP